MRTIHTSVTSTFEFEFITSFECKTLTILHLANTYYFQEKLEVFNYKYIQNSLVYGANQTFESAAKKCLIFICQDVQTGRGGRKYTASSSADRKLL